MFKITPLEVDHINSVLNEPMNQDITWWRESGRINVLANLPFSFAGLVNGEIVVIGGLIELWKNRAHLWTVFSKTYEKYPVATFRGMREFLEAQPFDRIEIDTPTDVEKIHRRARMLGFQLECRIARRFSERGESRTLYSWVRN